MSYDPYNDPMNPVDKPRKHDMGSDPGYHVQGGSTGAPYVGTDEVPFEYGSGGRDIAINPAADGVAGGYTEAQRIYANWDREAGNDYDSDDSVSPAVSGP